MKNYIYILLFLLCAGSLSAQNKNENAVLKEEIRKLDLAEARAILKADAVALDLLMDNDITVNSPRNQIVKEKKELLDLVQKGVIRYKAFERIPETFLFYKDMVVVMGSETVIPAEGAPNANKKIQRRYTNIWMKRNDAWRLTVRHANNVCSSTD